MNEYADISTADYNTSHERNNYIKV